MFKKFCQGFCVRIDLLCFSEFLVGYPNKQLHEFVSPEFIWYFLLIFSHVIDVCSIRVDEHPVDIREICLNFINYFGFLSPILQVNSL